MGKRITVIGATNTDIAGRCLFPMVLEDSNIGSVSMSLGGVGHNTAMNLALLGEKVYFITALGNDLFGRNAREEMEKCMDISSSLLSDERSGVYLFVTDENGDMHVAVNDMGITDLLTPDFLLSHRETIENAEIVVLDANLQSEAIHTASSLSSGIVAVDAVSTLKADRLRPSFPYINILKVNVMELEHLSGMKTTDVASIREASSALIKEGVKSVVTTAGKKGAYYSDGSRFLFVGTKKVDVRNTNGCGDSFLAGLMAGISEDRTIEYALSMASAAAAVSAMDEKTISDNMKRSLVESLAKEIKVEEIS